jgi:hypothetical protein
MDVDADVDVAITALPVATNAIPIISSVVGQAFQSPDSPCSGRSTDHESERTYTYSPIPQHETHAMEDAPVLPIQFHFPRYLMTVL